MKKYAENSTVLKAHSPQHNVAVGAIAIPTEGSHTIHFSIDWVRQLKGYFWKEEKTYNLHMHIMNVFSPLCFHS